MLVTDELDWRCFPACVIAQFDGSDGNAIAHRLEFTFGGMILRKA